MASAEAGKVVRPLLGKPGGFGQRRTELDLEKRIDGHVRLRNRRAPVLRPDARRRLAAWLEIAAGDPARLMGDTADDRQQGLDDIGRSRHEAVISELAMRVKPACKAMRRIGATFRSASASNRLPKPALNRR